MTWLLVLGGFMALVVLHEAGHFTAAKLVGMRVEKFSLFFGPMLVKFRRGETTYGIGPIPLGGYVKITGMNPAEELPPEVAPRAYFAQPPWKRIVVILAGPAVNLLIAFALVWGLLAIHGVERTTRTVAGTQHAPAAKHLLPGDHIVAVDGNQHPTVPQVMRLVNSHRCAGAQTDGCVAKSPVHLTVRRDGRLIDFSMRPVYNADPQVKRMLLGFEFGSKAFPQPVGTAAGQSVSQLWSATTGTVSNFARIFVSSKARKDVHSIVGGVEIAREAFGFSTAEGIWVLAVISLTLGLVNLFPFLPLDGGHVFWAVAEKVRGRRIPFSVMERTGFVGFALIMFVVVIGLSNDIPTITSGRGFLPR